MKDKQLRIETQTGIPLLSHSIIMIVVIASIVTHVVYVRFFVVVQSDDFRNLRIWVWSEYTDFTSLSYSLGKFHAQLKKYKSKIFKIMYTKV